MCTLIFRLLLCGVIFCSVTPSPNNLHEPRCAPVLNFGEPASLCVHSKEIDSNENVSLTAQGDFIRVIRARNAFLKRSSVKRWSKDQLDNIEAFTNPHDFREAVSSLIETCKVLSTQVLLPTPWSLFLFFGYCSLFLPFYYITALVKDGWECSLRYTVLFFILLA